MTGVSPRRWHLGRCCCCCSEGQKYVFLLSQFQKECETEKGVPRWVVTGLTPGENADALWLWHHSLVSSLSCLQTQTCRQMSLLTTGWTPPARERPGASEGKLLQSSQEQKCLPFSSLINITTFQFFSKKYFPFKETLKFKLSTPATPCIIWSVTFMQAGACLIAGVYCSSQWLRSPGIF